MNTLMNVGATASRMIAGFTNMERFEEAQQQNAPVTVQVGGATAVLIVLLFIALFVFVIANSYGAARLSQCQNLSIGNSEGVALLYAILCWIFPSMYYPQHAIFLNPICAMTKGRNVRINNSSRSA